MHGRENLRQRICNGDLDLLTCPSITYFHHTIGEPAAYDNDRRHAHDLGIGELHARARRPVIQQHCDACLVELNGEIGRRPTDHLFLAGRDNMNIKRR
jgi:hypothetical protein